MITEKIQKLRDMEAQAAQLKKTIEIERAAELASLPRKYGYDSVEDFVKAVREASGKRRGRTAKGGKRSKRTKITDAIRNELKILVGKGVSGSAIAQKLGISIPSVHNIKKDLGLVKSRKGGKKPAAKQAASK